MLLKGKASACARVCFYGFINNTDDLLGLDRDTFSFGSWFIIFLKVSLK